MKIHFALALPWQFFYRGWQDFILRASATSAKTLTRNKLVRLLPLLHISPRIRSITSTILKDHQYTLKVRCHPLFVAAYAIIITICFTNMTNNRFTSQIYYQLLHRFTINLAISRVVFLQAARLLQFNSLRKFRAD